MHDVTQLYKQYKKEERDDEIRNLISDDYLEAKKMPKPNTKKTPTYYFITDKGKAWVKNYLMVFQKT
ncbi:MAG TPA: hypothetical protein VLI69_01170 [Gammaproteobacteria bacterium]|nr:hypothetical protein [Gammaproteobacteria bacterium]